MPCTASTAYCRVVVEHLHALGRLRRRAGARPRRCWRRWGPAARARRRGSRRSGRRRCRRSRRRSTACTAPCPCRILPRSLLSVALTYAAAPGPVTISLAEVADVEDADRLAHGGVLLDHARGVLQRHRPAAELRELGARARRAGRAAATAGAPCRGAVSSAMPANLHRPDAAASGRRTTRMTILRPGDHLPPAGREPGQDPGRRRRRRGLEERQGRDSRRRRGGRRRGVRALAAPAAEHPRLHRQGRRGRPRADRRHARRARCWSWSASASSRATAPPSSSPYAGPRGRGPRRRPTPPRSRSPCPPTTPSLVRTVARGLPARRLRVRAATSPRRPTSGPARSPCSARPPAARRRSRAFEDGAGRRRAPSTRARDWVNTPAGDLTPPLFADEIVGGGQGHQGQGRRSSTTTALAELGCGGILGVGSGSSAPAAAGRADATPPRERVAHLALVGKGITFDSGGLTIKPGRRHGRR